MKYDVIVVGAGPAGLMAARELEKNNINYLVIDSKKEIGLPLRCGEGLRLSVAEELFDQQDIKRENGFLNKVKCFEIRFGSASRIVNVPYYELDRPRFEHWLSERVKNRLRLETNCKDIIIKNNCAEVVTDKGLFLSNIVILCYGSNFYIQKKYKLLKGKVFLLKLYGGIAKGHALKPDRLLFQYDKHVSGIYWVFPKDKNKANIGFGTTANIDIKKEFGRIFKIIPEVKNAKIIYAFSGVVPCSGPIKRTYHDRMLICGNAAGLTHAASGEGIPYALLSGKNAAETALRAVRQRRFDKRFFRSYERLWKEKIGKLIRASSVALEVVQLAHKYNVMEEVFKAPPDEEIYGYVSTGQIPLKTTCTLKIVKLIGLGKNIEVRKKFPRIVKLLYRLFKYFE